MLDYHFLFALTLLWSACWGVMGGAGGERGEAASTSSCFPMKVPGCADFTHARYSDRRSWKNAGKRGKKLSPYLQDLEKSGSANDALLQKIWCYQLAPPCGRQNPPPCRQMCESAEDMYRAEHRNRLQREEVRRVTRGVRCTALPKTMCDASYHGKPNNQIFTPIPFKHCISRITLSYLSFLRITSFY